MSALPFTGVPSGGEPIRFGEPSSAVITEAGQSASGPVFRVRICAEVEMTLDELAATMFDFLPEELTAEAVPGIVGTEITVAGLVDLARAARKAAAWSEAGTAGRHLALCRKRVRELATQARPARASA
jgi:hypothetical protein